jgi:hypothetical protein
MPIVCDFFSIFHQSTVGCISHEHDLATCFCDNPLHFNIGCISQVTIDVDSCVIQDPQHHFFSLALELLATYFHMCLSVSPAIWSLVAGCERNNTIYHTLNVRHFPSGTLYKDWPERSPISECVIGFDSSFNVVSRCLVRVFAHVLELPLFFDPPVSFASFPV